MKLLTTFWALASASLVLCSNHHVHQHQKKHEKLRSLARSSPEWDSWNSTNGGIINAAYYVSWAIYGRQFFPYEVDTRDLTHLIYAFANVNNVTGEVYLSDLWADTQIQFPGHEVNVTTQGNSTANILHGNLGQLYLLKKKNRNLKTLLSIGGWTYSPNFAPGTDTEEKRKTFATSAVKILEECGFDGIDIDWEYPSSETEAANLVALLAEIRSQLDEAEKKRSTPTKFFLTAAVPAGITHYSQLDVAGMASELDAMALMAYEYSGSYSNFTGYFDNFYPDPTNPDATPFDTMQAIEYYISNGLAPSDLLLGMPLYGPSFTHTKGMGKPFNGTGAGSWQAGLWDYKVLPPAGCEVTNNFEVVASYCYDSSNETLYAYDTPEIVTRKAQLASSMGLGGGMYWETSGDKPAGQGSLIETFVESSGGRGNLKQERNCLEYPGSPYDNIKN